MPIFEWTHPQTVISLKLCDCQLYSYAITLISREYHVIRISDSFSASQCRVGRTSTVPAGVLHLMNQS